MVEDGTLENILLNYVNVTKVYETTVEMLNDSNLKNGMKVKTLGYYELNDGGGADFTISNEINSNYLQFELANNLYANLLIKNNTINFKSLGAKQEDKLNNLFDNKLYLEKFVNFNNSAIQKYKLFIPSGIYAFTETNISSSKGFEIIGENSFSQWLWNGTIFVPFNDNQSHIIKVGNETNPSYNITIDNIIFSSAFLIMMKITMPLSTIR